jgi:hypothetical protein
MGWKAVKEHYQINHIVHMRGHNLCIGSGYISDIIVVSPSGEILKRYEWGSNDDLGRYQREIEADPAKFRELLEASDTFTDSVTVYTYCDAEIQEKLCEAPGWPNVTHDGRLMYDNTFSTDKGKIVARAKEEAMLGVRFVNEKIERIEKDLNEARADRSDLEHQVARLAAEYPETESSECTTP